MTQQPHEKNPAILMTEVPFWGITVKAVTRYVWPGGYPIFYVTKDGGVLSPEAVEENLDQCCDADDPSWFVVAHEVNWEDTHLYCEHTGDRIESAYAEDEAEEQAEA